MYIVYTMNQNKYSPQTAFMKMSYGSVNVYDDIRDKWITLQTHQVGDLKFSVQELDHHGWLICDGRSFSISEKPELYAVIGQSFGSNTVGTFKIPDMRGRVAGGIGGYPGSPYTFRSVGNVVGSETHTLTINEMPSHSHTSNAVGGTLGLVTSDGNNTASGGLDFTTGEPNLYAAPTELIINATGGGLAHNNMQPTLFIGNMFIYAPSVTSPW